jgi:mannosylglycerate hydrolase
MDRLIELMENDADFKFYTLDGQSIMLHDYLEARPRMKERLAKLIKDGRILIGPWYSLADCFSVNPESIVRNLLMGREVCAEYGGAMQVGYSIFSFGQMAQLPQVYSGFGIHDIVFYKGASEKVTPKSEFLWLSPDGTEAFATRLGKEKRWNFFACFSIPVILGGSMLRPGWKSGFQEDVRLCHMIDERFRKHHAVELAPDIRIRQEEIARAARDAVQSVEEESASDHVFLGFEGTDFTAPLKEIPEALRLANTLLAGEAEFIHSTPTEYFKEVKRDIDMTALARYQGEMRFGPVSHVHSETMGTNVEIKQAMFEAENLLINYAEPLTSMYKAEGGRYDKDLFTLAWRYLLASQAHDSVHGAGDPKIKTDTLNRLAQVVELAEGLTRRAVEGLSAMIDTAPDSGNDLTAVIFNTTPYTRAETIRLTLDLPAEELVEEYWVEDMAGNRLPCYQTSRQNFNLGMVHPQNRPKTVYCDRAEADVYVEEIPPMGFRLLKIRRVCGNPAENQHPFPQGVFPYDPIFKGGNVMDNGLIRLTVNTDGTVDLYDYETKRTYGRLNYFADTGCSGDFWVHREPCFNETVFSTGGGARITVTENSGLSATCKVSVVMRLPEKLVDNRSRRGGEYAEAEIVSEITMRKNAKRVDFKVFFNNTRKDHMLTAVFPCGIDAERFQSECPFEVRERPVGGFTDDNGKKGEELQRYSFHNFADVSDGTAGLALMTKGLKEIGVTRDADGGAVWNLTLLRAVTGTFPVHHDLFLAFDGETSQALGEHTFEYALYPHGGDYASGGVIEESRKYAAPLLAAELGRGGAGVLRDGYSFLRQKNNALTVCAVKLSEDEKGILLRLNNPGGRRVEETLCLSRAVKAAYLTNLAEDERILIGENTKNITFTAEPYKIVTVYLEGD